MRTIAPFNTARDSTEDKVKTINDPQAAHEFIHGRTSSPRRGTFRIGDPVVSHSEEMTDTPGSRLNTKAEVDEDAFTITTVADAGGFNIHVSAGEVTRSGDLSMEIHGTLAFHASVPKEVVLHLLQNGKWISTGET